MHLERHATCIHHYLMGVGEGRLYSLAILGKNKLELNGFYKVCSLDRGGAKALAMPLAAW